MKATTMTQSHSGIRRFVVIQLVIVAVMVSMAAAAIQTRPTVLESLPVLHEPIAIQAQHNWPWVVSDEQLTHVLTQLRPRLRRQKPNINYIDHALRFWGASQSFSEHDCLDGPEMKAILMDQRRFRALWGDDEPPLVSIVSDGLAVRVQQGAASSSHVDHTLATLAEVGVLLDEEIILRDGTAQVRDLFDSAIRRFHLNQNEYEWTALAAALYAPTPSAWRSQDGQRLTFDLLAQRIMREPLGEGVCYGQHRLYTLTAMLQVHERQPIFSTKTRESVVAYLQEVTGRLSATQSWEGWWDANWPHGQEFSDSKLNDDRARRILATGHVLEWWAIAPDEILPTRDTVTRAGQWLVHEISSMDEAEIEKNYTFLTHAGRALALWRRYNPQVGDKSFLD
jgi:hypothetical protein